MIFFIVKKANMLSPDTYEDDSMDSKVIHQKFSPRLCVHSLLSQSVFLSLYVSTTHLLENREDKLPKM